MCLMSRGREGGGVDPAPCAHVFDEQGEGGGGVLTQLPVRMCLMSRGREGGGCVDPAPCACV